MKGTISGTIRACKGTHVKVGRVIFNNNHSVSGSGQDTIAQLKYACSRRVSRMFHHVRKIHILMQ